MAHGDAREGKLRGKMWMEWVASSLALYVGTWSIHGLSADLHSSTASSQLNWPPRRFKWTCLFCWKTKSGFCACAITFQTCSTAEYLMLQTRCRINRCHYNQAWWYTIVSILYKGDKNYDNNFLRYINMKQQMKGNSNSLMGRVKKKNYSTHLLELY